MCMVCMYLSTIEKRRRTQAGAFLPVRPQTPLHPAGTLGLEKAEHVAAHRVLEDAKGGQAELVGVADVPAAGLRHQPSEDGVVRHEHEEGNARAEDVAGEQSLGGLVSARHPAPVVASAAGPRRRRAVAGLPALRRLVAGGRVAHEIPRVHGGDVLAESKVAEAGNLAILVQEDVFGLVA